MNNIPQEKYPIDPAGTAVGHAKVEAHSEPDHNGIYLDYGPPLPDSYHQDIIVALIRDPECIFCYWELSGTAVTTVLGNAIEPNLKWILRVHNLPASPPCPLRRLALPPRDSEASLGCPEGQRGESQKSFNDIVLSTPQNYSNPPDRPPDQAFRAGMTSRAGIQGNYYLTVLPETKYQLEFGVFTTDNQFISLVKSNIVTTPRRNKAPMTDTTSISRIENHE